MWRDNRGALGSFEFDRHGDASPIDRRSRHGKIANGDPLWIDFDNREMLLNFDETFRQCLCFRLAEIPMLARAQRNGRMKPNKNLRKRFYR